MMKYLPVALALLLAAAAKASSTTSKDAMVQKVKTALLAPNHGNRLLALSEECIAANEALAADPAFAGPLNELYESCPESISQSANALSIDFSVCGTGFTDDLTAICNSVNGTTVQAVPIDLTCTLQGETVTLSIDTVVECLDQVCDPSKYEEYVNSLNQSPEILELFGALGLDCTFGSTGDGSGAHHAGFAAGSAALIASFATALVL